MATRVVWVGNTTVEREQRYGYWETALLAATAGKKITFRNLGWSGDTVFGDARAAFDTPAKGFEWLISLTLELKPTVILVSYGTNESFEGEAGLGKFEVFEKLLDALKPANARIVLFSPVPFERHANCPQADAKNANLAKYADAIRRISSLAGHRFADLYQYTKREFESFDKESRVELQLFQGPRLTENGMHLTQNGYRRIMPPFLESLGLAASPDSSDFEKLRLAVVAKNQLFFYKWRPQNETYFFGFRKHEQGKNAKEVVEFDPLIAKAEEEIAFLRKK